MARTVSMDVSEAAKSITLEFKLTGLQKYRVRIWCATQILRLAAFVAGTKAEVDVQIRP